MPVWIGKANAFRISVVPIRTARDLVLHLLVLGSTSVMSAAQRPAALDPTPDEHHAPSVTDIERMEAKNPADPSPHSDQNTAEENCLLPPLSLITTPSISAMQLQASAMARWEYHKACASLSKKKYSEGEKHLRKALSQAPQYAGAWVTLGQVLDREQRTEEARRACLQGASVESSYIPAYLCLSDIAARARAWDEVLRLSSRAIELDPANNAVAYEYHAAALLNLHQLTAAEKSGLRAVEIDKGNREPRTHFVLAQIYEAKGDSAREAAQLREYLQYAQDPADIKVLRDALAKLQAQAGNSPPQIRAIIGPEKVAPPRWAPADVDEWIPPVLSSACPLAQILERTTARTEDLIDNLQRFSANERIELTDTDKNGKKRSAVARDVNYVAQITQNSLGYPRVEEYRSGAAEGQPSVLDSGIAAFALIFHPTHVGNFDFRCEGQTELRGMAAWQLRFEESADPKKAFTSIRVGNAVFLPRFKGRAWIATDNSEVLRIETDLSSPIPQVDLQLAHMIIDYAPVEFPNRQARLWLPVSTNIYLAYHGHHYERSHKFTHFQLFSVDAVESVQTPVSDKIRFMP
jgi:tetratricopeptide (TPR) repeat protein